MKIYIKCMGQSRNDIRNDLDNKGDQLVEHLVKIILYRERGNLVHWCDELGSFIHKVPKLKSRNRFPDKDFIYHSIWDTESERLSQTIDYIQHRYKAYNGYDVPEHDVRAFIEEYIGWLSEQLSKYGAVYVSQCADVAMELLDKYRT